MQITRRVTLWTHALIKNATLNVQRRAKRLTTCLFVLSATHLRSVAAYLFYREQQPPPLVTGDVGTIAIAEMDLLIE